MKNKKTLVVYGDGVTDDTEALQAYINGEADLIFPDGKSFTDFRTNNRTCVISRTLKIKSKPSED